MKKTIATLSVLAMALSANAQFNIQLHYDLGSGINDAMENRQTVTSTLEYFRADKLGSTFLFVDMDYLDNKNSTQAAISAYWEIGRDFTLCTFPADQHSITAHIEYDGGLGNTGSYQAAALLGPVYNWHSKDFSKTFSLQALYKQFFKLGAQDALASYQLTTVWGINFANGLCTFSGFADLWYGYIPKFDANGQQKGMVFLTEPQFWFNVVGRDRQNDRLSIGTEWELSNNFAWPSQGEDSFFFNPTIAVKYTF